MELLDKRHHQLCRIQATVLHRDQCHRDQYTRQYLQAELHPCRQSKISFVDNLGIVVGKTDCRKSRSRKHRHPHEAVLQIRPQQRRHNNRNRNQDSAHRRRPGFFLVRLRPFFSNVLSDLEFAKAFDYQWPNDQSCEHRRKAGKSGPEGQIAKDPKRWKIMKKF